jgi:outer membrane protein insertion porin family
MIASRPFCLVLPGLLLAAALVAGSRAAAGESPAGKIIADIVTINNRVHPKENILSQMQSRPGKPYDEVTIAEDVRRLIGTRWFAPGGVKVETSTGPDGRVTVYVHVIELNNVVQEVKFIGAQHMSHNDLLTLTGIRRGSPLNPAFNEAAAQAIQNKYREDGRYFCTVSLTEGNKLTDTRVVFNITEGPKVKVGRVRFKGCQATNPLRLETQVTSAVPFGLRILAGKFTPMQLELDKQKLIDYFHKLGHLEAKVREEIIPSRDLATVDVVFHIDEGPVYTVREVKLDGNRAYPVDKLLNLTELKPGKRYDRDQVEGDIARLKTYYGNRGYAVGIEEQLFAVPNQPGFVDVVYKIYEPGPRDPDTILRTSHQVGQGGGLLLPAREPDRVGRIIIEGNTVTADRVILNEIGLRPGQILQYPLLEQARLNLMRRGVFDPENPPTIEVIPNEFDSVYKDIRIRVNETRTGQFLIGAGINSNSGINGNIVLNERNFDILRPPTSWEDVLNGRAFRGGGQELRIEAMPGNIFQRYAITWREPYLFDSQFGLTNSAYYFNRAFAEYHEDRYGGRFTIDRRLDPIWRASFTTRVEGVNLKNIPFWATPAITDDAGSHFLLGLRAGLTRDTRDSFIFPTTGSVFEAGYEQVLGDYTFPIGTAEYTQFFSSEYLQRRDGSGKHVLAVRSQLSVTGQDAPVFERFFAGGFRSLRGFSFRGVGPAENQLFIGGTFALLNTVEYQIPLTAKDNLFFVTFVDHGTVERTVAIRDYRVSVGFGFRVQIPALGPVPVAFDFAFPLNKTPDDNRQIFAFYIGMFGGQ